jgi:hypothetical protein
MNHFFRVLMTLLSPVLLLCGPAGRGQQIPPQYADTIAKLKAATPDQRAQMQTDLMKQKLSLTAEQYKQVSAINLFYARKIEPILRGDANRYSKYLQISPLLDEKDEKLKAVFSAGQFKKYQDVKSEMIRQARKAMSS